MVALAVAGSRALNFVSLPLNSSVGRSSSSVSPSFTVTSSRESNARILPRLRVTFFATRGASSFRDRPSAGDDGSTLINSIFSSSFKNLELCLPDDDLPSSGAPFVRTDPLGGFEILNVVGRTAAVVVSPAPYFVGSKPSIVVTLNSSSFVENSSKPVDGKPVDGKPVDGKPVVVGGVRVTFS